MEKRRKTEITQALSFSRGHSREGSVTICVLIHKLQPQHPAPGKPPSAFVSPTWNSQGTAGCSCCCPWLTSPIPIPWARLRVAEHLGTEVRLHSDFGTGTASPDGPVCKAARLCSLTVICYFSVGSPIRQDLFFLEEG